MNKGVRIGVVLIVLVAGSVIKEVTKKATTPAPLSVEEELARAAKGLKLPVQVDPDSRFDEAVAGPGRNLKYVYTLVNLSLGDMDTNKFVETMTAHLNENYKTSPKQEYFRNNGIAMTYVYRDKDSNTVAKITVLPELVAVPDVR